MAALGTPPSRPVTNPHSHTTPCLPKGFSCVLCAQRKVKCDRRPGGCANCAKAHVPCLYKAPPPARRRKKGERDVDTTTRMRLYEDALRQLGVDPDDVVKQGVARASSDPNVAGTNSVRGINDFLERNDLEAQERIHSPSELGVLVTEEGKSRYLGNGIWTSLQSEFRDSKDILDDSSDEESPDEHIFDPLHYSFARGTGLLFMEQRLPTTIRSLHPDPVQIFKLWQSYLDNINPLVKVFHAPTVQQLILDSTGNLDDVPRNVEALLFAMYCISVESLSEGECMAMLRQPKSSALRLFRYGAQCALTNASLLRSSDLLVLQAFTLFILSLQSFDARVVWIWSGVAQRIAQRIGLHRDGAKLGLPPFEVEIRRRLWWQISMMEGFSQKLAGVGTSGNALFSDVGMPSNVNDSDLFPGMQELPKEHQGTTEMMFFRIRCHVAEFLKRSANARTTFDGIWSQITTSNVPTETKDQAINELELLIQRKFLQYCDSSIPWHVMCSQLGKAIISMLRFMAHSAGYYGADTQQDKKDTMFAFALQVVLLQNQAYTMTELQGFIWHVNLHFQWKAFLFVLSELRYRTQGSEVVQAWKEVEKTYEYHPSFDKELAQRALPVAVSNLTLKAWEAYIAVRDVPEISEPYFIQLIRLRQEHVGLPNKSANPSKVNAKGKAGHTSSSTEDLAREDLWSGTDMLQALDWSTVEPSGEPPISSVLSTVQSEFPEDIDWAAWKDLFVDIQANDTSGVMQELSTLDYAM